MLIVARQIPNPSQYSLSCLIPMKLRVACVQFNPLLGKIEANISKVKTLLSGVKKEIDLIVLPELSVTGYNFSSPQEISPFLEDTSRGATCSLAKELSKQYGCATVIGYPETSHGKTYNSALVVDDTGKIIYNYRKTHLYETDETWGCSENEDKEFPPFALTLGKKDQKKTFLTNVGICMDLNPYKFEAPFNEFEFSLSCWANDSSLIIVPTAWLSSDSPSIQDEWTPEEKQKRAVEWQRKFETKNIEDEEKSSNLLVNYWILRFFPFLSHPSNQLPSKLHKTTVVLCNRSGLEGDVLYGGSSSIIQFDPAKGQNLEVDCQNPSVEVLGSAGWANEEVLYRELEV